MRCLALIFLLFSGFAALLPASEQPEVRVQSIECNYGVPEGRVCCTLRLHVQLPTDAAFVPPPLSREASSPLIGVDAEGRILLGRFRFVEPCMDHCRTLVYDFCTLPHGGWVEFNTSVELLFSSSRFQVSTQPFDPKQSGSLHAFNHTFFVSPLPPTREIPESVLFRLDYTITPLIAAISFCNSDGSVGHTHLIKGSYSKEASMTSATYLLSPAVNKKLVMRLSFFHSPVPHNIPVRFRIHPGLVAEPFHEN